LLLGRKLLPVGMPFLYQRFTVDRRTDLRLPAKRPDHGAR
jgi:hypothetical protein